MEAILQGYKQTLRSAIWVIIDNSGPEYNSVGNGLSSVDNRSNSVDNNISSVINENSFVINVDNSVINRVFLQGDHISTNESFLLSRLYIRFTY